MQGVISLPSTGIMGMGAVVESQKDLSFRLAQLQTSIKLQKRNGIVENDGKHDPADPVIKNKFIAICYSLMRSWLQVYVSTYERTLMCITRQYNDNNNDNNDNNNNKKSKLIAIC